MGGLLLRRVQLLMWKGSRTSPSPCACCAAAWVAASLAKMDCNRGWGWVGGWVGGWGGAAACVCSLTAAELATQPGPSQQSAAGSCTWERHQNRLALPAAAAGGAPQRPTAAAVCHPPCVLPIPSISLFLPASSAHSSKVLSTQAPSAPPPDVRSPSAHLKCVCQHIQAVVGHHGGGDQDALLHQGCGTGGGGWGWWVGMVCVCACVCGGGGGGGGGGAGGGGAQRSLRWCQQ